MPGRAFIPSALPTETLRELHNTLQHDELRLMQEHEVDMDLWGELIKNNASQSAIDRAEYACDNSIRRQRRVYNKIAKIRAEIFIRDQRELRGIEMDFRRR